MHDGFTVCCKSCCFFFQAEDGIRDSVASRGLGDVYKRQPIQVAHALQKLLGYFNHNCVTSVASSDAWQGHHAQHAWNEISESRE